LDRALGSHVSIGAGAISTGKWYKLKQWTRLTERPLVADTRVWLLEAMAAPMSGDTPAQALFTDQVFWTSTTTGETAYDFYRFSG
jgi:hypothetical protein